MEIELAFGKAQITLELPSGIKIDTFDSAKAGQAVDLKSFQRTLLQARGGDFSDISPLFVVNDGYRHTPTLQVLRWLDRTFDGLIDRSSFLIATGTHDAPTDEHLGKIFGEFFDRVKDRLNYHSAISPDLMASVGTDRFGSEVFVNKQVLAAGRVCIIGSVEPHYFAGFTGGRKSLFPGLTDLATVERNHNLANSLEAAPLKLAGNPVHEHLQSLTELVDTSGFVSIQLVVDTAGEIAGVYAGDFEGSFVEALTMASAMYAHTVSEPYDAVICELLPPLNKNLYQVQKAFENTQSGVADGGAVIVLSACEEGVGSDHFFELADNWDTEKNQPADGVQRFGSHKLFRVNAMRDRIDVCLHSTLPDDVVRRVFYEPLADIKEYLDNKSDSREGYRVAVVRDAGHTVLTRQSLT